MRASLALAALLTLAAAVPASASGGPAPTPPQDCAAVVAPVGTGPSAGCSTLGNPPALPGGVNGHNLRLTVATGSATATLSCAEIATSVTLTLAKPGTATGTLLGGDYCWVTLNATSGGTTAVAWDISTYVFP